MDNSNNQTINVTSFNQQGGITANQVILSQPNRHFVGEIKDKFLQRLPNDKNRTIRITSVMGDEEAFAFADEIKNYLIEEGFTVEGVNRGIFDRPMIGQFIKNESHSDIFEIQIGNKPS